MLLSVSPAAIPLAASRAQASEPNPVIEAMVNLMPDYSAGRRLHDLYVNKLQSALPGNYSQMFGTGPAFRGIFYPSWQSDPLMSAIGSTGLDDGWWRNFSVALLCQAIRELASDIRGQMLTDKINGDVAANNATLRAHSAIAYSAVLAAAYTPFVTLLRQVDRATAKQQFHDSLLANVINRQLWYQAGMWTSPEWEMFNQYAKYLALGASTGEVDALIGETQGGRAAGPGRGPAGCLAVLLRGAAGQAGCQLRRHPHRLRPGCHRDNVPADRRRHARADAQREQL